MTGEISLRGRVLPIGGLKTKILAGRRAGIENFILPKKNENKFKEIEKEITRGLNVSFVSHMDEVMNILLLEDENHADH
jgi:ATP-dependent Lon protease